MLRALGLPTAGGLTLVGVAMVLLAPSFAITVAGAAVLGLAGTVVMIDIFIRIGLAEDRDCHAAQADSPSGEGDEDPAPAREHGEAPRRLTRAEWKPRRRP